MDSQAVILSLLRSLCHGHAVVTRLIEVGRSDLLEPRSSWPGPEVGIFPSEVPSGA
jgi:hypothetical protein